MPQYKLTYFDLYGRGEVTRLIFAAAKVEYEDDRVTFEQWPALKSKMTFGQLPVLFIEGQKPLAQSLAMETYLASEYGLNGSNNLEAAYISMIAGTLGDVFFKLPFMEKDPKVKEEKSTELWKEKIMPALQYFEKELDDKSREFLVGDKLSSADLFMMQALLFSKQDYSEQLKSLPNLCAHRDRIAQVDGVRQYLASRKPCIF